MEEHTHPDKNIQSYKIVYPLTDEHYYNLILEHEPSDDLIVKTYNFIKQFVEHSNRVVKPNMKKIIRFIKGARDSIVWLVLIKLLPYKLWIELYAECNALKYFWSKELLEQIIDSNSNSINLHLLNESNKISYLEHIKHLGTTELIDNNLKQHQKLTQTNHLINLLNQYNLNWNFTQKVLNKRLAKFIQIFAEIFDDFNLSNFITDQHFIKLLGNNHLASQVNGQVNGQVNSKLIEQINLYFYPIKSCTIKLKQGIKYTVTDELITIYYQPAFFVGYVLIHFSKQITKLNYIFAQNDVSGIMSFVLIEQNMTEQNITEQNNIQFQVNEIFANAGLYQEFDNNQQINHQIKHPINRQNYLVANQYAVLKFCKLFHSNTYLTNNIKHNYNKCYECKAYYDDRFCLSQYKCYCFDCGIKNYEYMTEQANLSSFTAFITGIRVKIGFATALRILRNGGKVIGTTRYPSFALANYAKEPDYNVWKSNLTIIKCDFLNIESVYKLLDIITSNKYQINAFINMAFRTVRPSSFYTNAVRQIEATLTEQFLIDNQLSESEQHNQMILYDKQSKQNIDAFTDLSSINTNSLTNYQPPVKINIFGDVVDVKLECSWDKTIDQIDPKEIVECTALNQLVPTLIINSLKPKLIGPKFIIHICSLEGQFDYNKKTDKHIHTNMCKSALNMLIRSLSEDLDPEFRAFAIDPGYVSGKKTDPEINELPVSMHDGAAKITWPIFRQLNGHPLPKDYVKIRNYNKEKW